MKCSPKTRTCTGNARVANLDCINVLLIAMYILISCKIHRIITLVQRDTGIYHEFIAEYCYECVARVEIPRQRTSDVSQYHYTEISIYSKADLVHVSCL